MCLGNDLFQAAPYSFRCRFVRECGRGQREHRRNRLAQVMRSLLDGAWPWMRIGQIPPGSQRRVRCLPYCLTCHVPHPAQTAPQQNVS